MRKRAMSWRNFERIYGPVSEAPDGSDMFSYAQLPEGIETNRVWSVVDAEGVLQVISGYHVVNMMGYVITAKPWGDKEEADFWASY